MDERIAELLKLDKHTLINVLLKSETIRTRQYKIIETLIKELQEYDDVAIEKLIGEMED